jgi:hypothetical protein
MLIEIKVCNVTLIIIFTYENWGLGYHPVLSALSNQMVYYT